MTSARDEVLLPPEVAERLRIDVSTLSTWRCNGYGPAWFRLGKKKVAYLESSIEAYLQQQVAASPAQRTT